MFLYIMRSYNLPVKKSTIQANYLLFQSERSPASDSFTSPSQDLNLLPSKIIVSDLQQLQQAILKELKCLFVDMVSKASQTVLLQQYCVLLSEFPNVIFHGSVEKSSMMMMISAKDTWCGGGGGAKLNSEIKANVLSPLHYVQVMCNHVQFPKNLWTRRMIEQGRGERLWPLLHLLELLEIATLIQTHSNPWIVSRRKVGIASLVAMICLVSRENWWRMHTAAGQIQKSVEETGEEFMQLIRTI